MKRVKILGMGINLVSKNETLNVIEGWLKGEKNSLRHVITAYSEFFVRAKEDNEFKNAWDSADLVVADGVGVLAAWDYIKNKSMGRVIGRCLKGQLGETVTGVWLTRALVKKATEKDRKVFLLGGFGETARELCQRLKTENRKLTICYDAGESKLGEDAEKNRQVIEKINEFKPDILLVAYGPGKQEKWIYENKKNLRAGVAIGVGGTFDELLDKRLGAPVWMERRGLKWLWRLIKQPSRLGRIWRAVVVFPWLVWRGIG